MYLRSYQNTRRILRAFLSLLKSYIFYLGTYRNIYQTSMEKGKKNKNRPRRYVKPSAKPPTTNTTDTGGDTAAPVRGGGGRGRSTPTADNPMNKVAASKIPNCHFVPRWILKNFAWQEGPRRSDDPEINCFDLGKETLTRLLVSQAYAKKGLFKDPDSAPGSVTYKLETELGQLESKASRCFQEIRNAVNNRDKNPSAGAAPVCIMQKRRYLQDLRKFMFVMYYHQLSIGETYYNKDHPGNVHLQDWIKDYCEKYGLSSCPKEKHIWLHVLQHYLRKEHDVLMSEGGEAERKFVGGIFDKLGPDFASLGKDMIPVFQAMAEAATVDPKLEEWKSLPYYNNMQMFLVIWEAAPGEEFLMSDNSFGLYEGRTDEAGPLHWIYVISPRIVLVLCHPGLKDTRHLPGFIDLFNVFQLSEKQRSMSMLLNAPHPAAKVKYKNEPLSSENIFYGNAGAAEAHPDDEFEIQISVLSSEDTHTINAIILGNVKKKGLLTFHSKDAALRTLDEFAKNREFDHELKLKFAPLAKQLSEDPDVRPNVHFNLQRFEPKDKIPPFRLPPLSTEPGTFWETSLVVYHTLHRGHDPQCISYRLWEKMHTERTKRTVGTGLQLRPARLVSKLDDNVAYVLFKLCTILLTTPFDGSTNLEVYLEQLIIGFLDNLLKNNRPFFDRIEEGVIKCLREGGQPELARAARIKELISPEDDDHVPVPVGFSFHDFEATADRVGIPQNPDMAYSDWAFARTHYIQDNMIPSELDLPCPPSSTKPEQGKEPLDLEERQLTDLFAKNKKFRAADLKQEIEDSVPFHLCVTADDPPGKEGVIPEESHDLHAEVRQGIHSNGGVGRGLSQELNPSFTQDVGVNTKVKQRVDQKTLMTVDQDVGGGRAWRDLGGVVSIFVWRLAVFFVVIVLAPVVYSVCIWCTVMHQAVEVYILCLQYQWLVHEAPPAEADTDPGQRTQLSASERSARLKSIHGKITSVFSTVTLGAIIYIYLCCHGSLTMVDLCTLLALDIVNNVDGQCTRILCRWVSFAWQ
ncbi:hypothetical protein DFP73DRAFT_530551 [Morchella snyderi]|nr:hypothetical protein DFP73DRAFT_530551 [Morchella snyderi]